MKALIIVDLQYDFLPGGKLAVPHGDEIIKRINELQAKFELMIGTPKNTKVLHLNIRTIKFWILSICKVIRKHYGQIIVCKEQKAQS